MQLIWHPAAQGELIAARDFYNSRVLGLGEDFLDSVDNAVRKIELSPDSFPFVEGSIQRCRVARFPYCLYFRQFESTIELLVVMHHHRHPDYWKTRM